MQIIEKRKTRIFNVRTYIKEIEIDRRIDRERHAINERDNKLPARWKRETKR